VHGIAALTAGVLVAAAAIALVTRSAWKEQAIRTAVALVVFVGAVVVTGLLFHEASGTTHAGGLVDQGGLADPTWEFYEAARGHAASMPPSNGSMLWDVLRILYSRAWWWLVPAALLAILGLLRRRADPRARTIVVFTVLSLVGLALVSSVFMLGWQGYVPRRTGASRIPLEASLLPPTFLAVGLGLLTREGWTWRSRTVRRPLPILLALLTITSLISMTGFARYNNGGSIGRHELALWESLPLRSGDVVLANGYTEGFIPDVTPATGLLDGRAPYTFGDLLRRANQLLRGAEAFFEDPAAHGDYLAEHHVTWVVVGNPDTYALSTGNTWDVPRRLDVLERCAGLKRVLDDPSLTVFRVVDPGPQVCS
jgi:cytochrome bd-type quinol oxidase subunit 2